VEELPDKFAEIGSAVFRELVEGSPLFGAESDLLRDCSIATLHAGEDIAE
jgi:hypothetical protein